MRTKNRTLLHSTNYRFEEPELSFMIYLPYKASKIFYIAYNTYLLSDQRMAQILIYHKINYYNVLKHFFVSSWWYHIKVNKVILKLDGHCSPWPYFLQALFPGYFPLGDRPLGHHLPETLFPLVDIVLPIAIEMYLTYHWFH